MTELLIQIINYNTKDYLETCLRGLINDLTTFDKEYRIVVLDNNSSDDLTSLAEHFGSMNVEFRRSEKNLGFGGGHNFISGLLDSKYILILNSDLKFIESDTVGRLYKRLNSDSMYSVAGPCLLLEDMSRQEFDHGEMSGLISYLKNNYGSSYWKPRVDESEAAWVSGAVFMCRTEAFKEAGGFDERFFLYKEEEDLCKRIRDKGRKILYYPEVKVMHIGHVVASRNEHFRNSMDYYLDKHFRNKLSYKLLHAAKVAKDVLIHGKIMERK